MYPDNKGGASPKRLLYDHRRYADEDVLVGRHTLITQLANGLRAGHSYGLIGAVGMGKTSTLLALKKELIYGVVEGNLPQPIPVYIKLDARMLRNLGNIVETIISEFINALIGQSALYLSSADRLALLQEARNEHLEEPLRILSAQYYQQQRHTCRLIVLLDDIHYGLGHEALSQFVSVLRPLVSPHDTSVNVSLILAGELPLEEELRKDVSSLRALLSRSITLPPLPPNDVTTLVALAEDYGWPVEPGCEKLAFQLTQGHPFKLHYYLFTALDTEGIISQAVLQKIHRDESIQNYLQGVLKTASLATRNANVIHLFYSYAEADRDWLERLEKQLASLRRQGKLQDWHIGKLKLSQDVKVQIAHHIHSADIILLLISPDYVDSEEIFRSQVQVAMDRQRLGLAQAVPILLRPVNWEQEPYHALQPLPRSGKWVSTQDNSDQVLAEIAGEIGTIVTNL